MIRLPDLVRKYAFHTPDKMATYFEGRAHSWAQFSARMHGAAKALQDLGVGPGDRVAFLGMNSHWLVEMYLVPSMIGALCVPINYRLSEDEMAETIDDCTPQILIVDRHFQEQAAALMERCPSLETLIFADWDAPAPVLPPDTLNYDDLIAQAGNVAADAFDDLASASDDTMILFYTSGTTGQPKGVMLSHSNMQANATGTGPLYKYRSDDVLLLSGPMFHLGTGSRVFTSIVYGTTKIIQAKFEVEETMRLIQDQKVTTMTMVPTMLRMILDHPTFPTFDFSSLRCLTYGAAPMPIGVISQCLEQIPDVTFCQGYGMTEAAPNLCVLRPEDHEPIDGVIPKLASVGRPIHTTDLRIVDENDKPVKQGETGELTVRGPQIMNGYWNKPEETGEAMRGGFYHTGDAGYEDEDGYIYLVGRTKEMIITGGENVYPIETENCLSKHPDVASAAVLGLPHDKWGEMVVAVVALHDGARVTGDDLIAYCRGKIAGYKVPKSIRIWDGPLPLSHTNKIDKQKIRAKISETTDE
ncbi:long-chain-fatty-acid--CoA ligase [Hoeflea prorocentri]|uniref:3-methylmercaptopropionyl-CoA ligase n=1 Tax=Hoeflea prorocentri TaxID=1922333 RepID=A0A9X3UF30_9HYPH|nr:long-chain-fatty-acid--CoA ligase [Hoeflea prorocentri]MCY6379705.1 long-chain-fatty-acid--CoA ligase [Hoeflea prorocentri]MDA5397505.1 long-chain-fatty-acid--CoA ligase [Hoeflea prorocentri]